jgi:CheY-like chemotaxis protein
VAEAGNGREGLVASAQAGWVDVIITDWKISEMSGIDFIRTFVRCSRSKTAGADVTTPT